METAEKYGYWAMMADYDMDTARVLISGKRWVYVAYMCHQALERQIKGMYVYYMNREAPKSHNLPFLFDQLRKCPGFPEKGTMDDSKVARLEDFFTEIMFYYMSDYPFSYKRIANRLIDGDTGMRLYARVENCIGELRTFQSLPGSVEKPEQQQSI